MSLKRSPFRSGSKMASTFKLTMHGSWLPKACSRASSARSFSPSPTHAIARNQHGTYSYFSRRDQAIRHGGGLQWILRNAPHSVGILLASSTRMDYPARVRLPAGSPHLPPPNPNHRAIEAAPALHALRKFFIQGHCFERCGLRFSKRLFRIHPEKIGQLDRGFCQSCVSRRILATGLNGRLKMLNRLALPFFKNAAVARSPYRFSNSGPA